jgi:hypothetical protein
VDSVTAIRLLGRGPLPDGILRPQGGADAVGDAAAREGVRQVAARWHLPVHTRRGPPAAEECARRGSLRQLPAPPARGPPRAASRRAIEWGRGRIAARSPSNARVRIVVLHEDIRHVGDRPRPLAPHRLVPFPCPPAHLLDKLLHCKPQTAVLAAERPARSHKSAAQNRFTVETAQGA